MAPPFKSVDVAPDVETPAIPVRKILADSKGVMRLSEVADRARASEEVVRRDLEQLEDGGDISMGRVGDHLIVRAEGQLREETKDRGGPRSDRGWDTKYRQKVS